MRIFKNVNPKPIDPFYCAALYTCTCGFTRLPIYKNSAAATPFLVVSTFILIVATMSILLRFHIKKLHSAT